jgi:hypothetical protein
MRLREGDNMNNKISEDKKDINAYFEGTDLSKVDIKEYKEISHFAKELSSNDFSKNSNKELIYKKVLTNVNNKKRGVNNMKKVNIKRSVVAAGIICVMGVTIAQSSYAQSFVNKVLNRITVGHIEAIQEDYSEVENDHAVYNNSSVVKKDDGTKDGMLIVKDTNKLNDYTCFNVILPKYLPEGYEFARAEFYKDEDGNVSKGKYIDLYFGNKETGKEVFMQQRFADEETAFTISTGENIEKVKINNVEGIVNGNYNVDWEYNGVIYGISTKKAGIDKSEVIKIAESIK